MSNAWHACTAVVAESYDDGTDAGAHTLYAPHCKRCGWTGTQRYTDGITALMAARAEHGHVHCVPAGAQTEMEFA